MGCAAAPSFEARAGAASRPSASKLARHRCQLRGRAATLTTAMTAHRSLVGMTTPSSDPAQPVARELAPVGLRSRPLFSSKERGPLRDPARASSLATGVIFGAATLTKAMTAHRFLVGMTTPSSDPAQPVARELAPVGLRSSPFFSSKSGGRFAPQREQARSPQVSASGEGSDADYSDDSSSFFGGDDDSFV